MASGSSFFESSARSLFRRCVQCPPQSPQCPSCGVGETCSLQAPSCDACASTSCVKVASIPGSLAEKSSTPVGAIAGGVIGGIAALAIIIYLVWRFCVKPKRQAVAAWDQPEKRDQSTLYRGGERQSTRSGHSIASTVLTRASNVIQIAYIPGVTVRSPPESPGLLAPPVPFLRGGSNYSSSASSPALEQHFFMPGDLRDSTWSDTSSVDPRISLAPSLARSTLYGDAEVVPPVPAQQAYRAQANMVSVKTGSSTPSHLSPTPSRTPPINQTQKLGTTNSSIVGRTVTARPIEVKKVGSAPRVPTLANLARQATKTSEATSSSEKAVPVVFEEKEALVGSPTTVIDDSPVSPTVKPQASFGTMHNARSSSVSAIIPSDGPLGSGSSPPVHRHSKSAGLNAMIEDAINRARDPHINMRPELKKYDSGPFSDANEVKENSL